MKIYKLANDVTNYKWVTYKGKIHYMQLSNMNGESIIEQWVPLKLQTIKERPDIPLGDYPNFDVPLISNDAKRKLENEIQSLVEFLPVEILDSDGEYYILNVSNILDCLDKKKPNLTMSSDGINILDIKEYSFNTIDNFYSKVFRIKNFEKTIYVNDDIKSLFENSGLKGFKFEDTSLPYENPFTKLLRSSKK